MYVQKKTNKSSMIETPQDVPGDDFVIQKGATSRGRVLCSTAASEI